MRKATGTFIFLFLSLFSYATHQVSGYIAITWLKGSTYQITVYDYTNCFPYLVVADRDGLRIHLGDNTSDSVTRINGRTNWLIPDDPNPNGEPLCNWDYSKATPVALNGARKVNIYQTTHTYPGPGVYRVWIDDQDRMANINNILNSVNVDYYMYTTLVIPPFANNFHDTSYYTSSPLISNPPACQYGCVGQCYTYNPGAYVPGQIRGTDDSISYSLGNCLQLNTIDPNNPEIAQGYKNEGAKVDPVTGTLTWCETDTGIYNFAILMTSYERVYSSLGGSPVMLPIDTVELEVEVVINTACYSPQVTDHDTCVVAGNPIALSYNAKTEGSNPLYITSSGEPFSESPPATLSNDYPPATIMHPVLHWQTTCGEVRENPYQVIIEATEKINLGADSIYYRGYGTSVIRIIAPPPRHLMAENEGSTVCLHWSPSTCAQDTIYNIYRRKGCTDWQPGYCETGVPAYTGYSLIATIHGLNDTTYCDSNEGEGLSPGVSYNYIVDCSLPLPDGSNSYASNDTCLTIKLGVPVLTNVSVTKTDPTDGKIFVKWIKPVADSANLDTLKFPAPYTYILQHATGMNGKSFSTIATIVSPHFNSPITLSYMDTGLNTKDNSYNYKINFYDSGSHFIGSSGSASSIYLREQREDKSIKLGWSASVPWDNDTFYVYRENPPPANSYTFLTKTTKTNYIDTGLHNGYQYCYYVESYSEYTGAKHIPAPLFDSSETICGVPEDTIAPCPPPLNVMAKCLLYQDSLVWDNPDRFCPKANKTLRYQIYFTPVENDDMYLIATINNPEDTTYMIGNLTSVAGCYAVLAIDSAGQTSSLNTQCVDNCVAYELPNVFTPNGDGVNDLFTPVEEFRFIKDIDINIYNRWGQVVFHTTNPAINWNGNVDNSGGACPEGVYYYVCVVNEIRVTGIQPVTLKGFIQLIRN